MLAKLNESNTSKIVKNNTQHKLNLKIVAADKLPQVHTSGLYQQFTYSAAKSKS
jgi:hypothetical protein